MSLDLKEKRDYREMVNVHTIIVHALSEEFSIQVILKIKYLNSESFVNRVTLSARLKNRVAC